MLYSESSYSFITVEGTELGLSLIHISVPVSEIIISAYCFKGSGWVLSSPVRSVISMFPFSGVNLKALELSLIHICSNNNYGNGLGTGKI